MDIEVLPSIPSNGDWVLKGQNGNPYWREDVDPKQMIITVEGSTGVAEPEIGNAQSTSSGCLVSPTSISKYPNVVRAFGEDNAYVAHGFSTKEGDKITKNGTDYRMLACQKATTGTVTWKGKSINLAGLNPTTNPMELICVTTNTNDGWLLNVTVSEKDFDIINKTLYYKKVLMFSKSATGGIINHFPEINAQLYNIIDVVRNSDGTLSWLMLVLKVSPTDIVYDANETWVITAPVPVDLQSSAHKSAGEVNIGSGNAILGNYSTGVGYFNLIRNQGSVAVGYRNTGDSASICIGDGNEAYNLGVCIGSQNTSTEESVAIGRMLLVGNLSKSDNRQISLGSFNKWEPDAYVMFADGTGKNARSNVMTIGAVGTNKDSNIMLADSAHKMFQANLPKPPTTAGNYKLKCSVDSNGAATYSWVSDN